MKTVSIPNNGFKCKNCIYKHDDTCDSPRVQRMICIDDDFSCGDITLKDDYIQSLKEEELS